MRLRKSLLLLISFSLSLACLCGCGKTSKYTYKTQDVSAIVKEAEGAFANKKYEDALNLYFDAMETEPKDIEARLGAVRCQIELENYSAAEEGLNILSKLDPSVDEIYDLYLTISEKEGNYFAARTAIALAKKYNHESMMSKVPSAPQISLPGGSYDSRQKVKLSCDDPEADIYYILSVTEKNGDPNPGPNPPSANTFFTRELLYDEEIPIYSGTTEMRYYSVRDGVPSEEKSVRYEVDYEGKSVVFKDGILEKLVRAELNKTSGKITDKELEKIQSLDFDRLSYNPGYDVWNDPSKYQIKSLEDLKYLPYLQSLSLEHQYSVKDYTPLSKCRFLESISWDESKIKNLNFLKYTPKLTYLRAYNDHELQDISAIKNCPDLTGISLSSRNLKKVSILKSYKKLRSLSISDKYISKDNLGDGKQIESLDIYGFDFNRDYVSGLKQLTRLDIGSKVSDTYYYYGEAPSLNNLGFLKKLKNLEEISLSGIKDPKVLEVLKDLPKLNYIYISLSTYDEGTRKKVSDSLTKAHPNASIYVY